MNQIQENCPICNVKATQICSACKIIKYCGVEHQKQHWKIHKNDCRLFTVTMADDVGRFLLAKRDIQSNTVIFTESPLIVGPKWYLTDKEIKTPILQCVGCFTSIKFIENLCSNCKWPVCNLNCPGLSNPKLHGLECDILRFGPGPSNPNDINTVLDYYRTDALVVLKCLMLQKRFPKKWSQLMDMQSHEAERLGSELYQDAENRIVSYLQSNYLKPLEKLEKQANNLVLSQKDKNILHKICGIIETNYMLINIPSGVELTGLFYNACMMEHSCQPNCYFTFDYINGFKISVIAGTDLKCGEHLKIMYSNMLWGTMLRQEHLQMTKHFVCKCDRCVDPTELKTYFSGLKCMGIDLTPCESGVLLPENPLNQNSDWKCNTCSVKIGGEEVRYLLTQMSEEVEKLLMIKPSILELENLINKLSKFLHENHYHLFNLKHSLIQLYGSENDSNQSNEILLRKIEMCNSLLSICEVLDPYTIRLSLYVAVVLYEKYSAIFKLNKKYLNTDSKEENLKALENIKDAHQLLLKAKKILEKEQDNISGVKLSETIKKTILELNLLISNYS